MADLNTTLGARLAVGKEATWQASVLLVELMHAARRNDDDSLQMLLFALVPRLITLNDTAMMAFDNDSHSTSLEDLHLDLVGGHTHLLKEKP